MIFKAPPNGKFKHFLLTGKFFLAGGKTQVLQIHKHYQNSTVVIIYIANQCVDHLYVTLFKTKVLITIFCSTRRQEKMRLTIWNTNKSFHHFYYGILLFILKSTYKFAFFSSTIVEKKGQTPA